MNATMIIRSLISRILYPETALGALARMGLTLLVAIGAMGISAKVVHPDYAVFPICVFMLISSAFNVWFFLCFISIEIDAGR